MLNVYDLAYDSLDSLQRLLNFFATLKDQYYAVSLALPADLPLNRLLKETQIPHRQVNHETADVRAFTRMQVRVLDHVRLVNHLRRLPEHVRGEATVAITETEGTTTALRIAFQAGQATASPSKAMTADIECADRDWAAIVLGDMSDTRAAELRLIRVNAPAALAVLDTFSAGPAPFCNEYF